MMMMTNFGTLTAMKGTSFGAVTLCSSVEVYRRFGGPYHLRLQGRRGGGKLVSCLAYSPTPKMEAIHSSETSVDFYHTTRCYVPEDSTLHSHGYENHKSNIYTQIFKV
jgi:hypothetical protein